MSELTSTDKLIRKLRKKLREIERLEISDRSSLNREEIAKIKRKKNIREELADLLGVENEEEKQSGSSCPNAPEKDLDKIPCNINDCKDYETRTDEIISGKQQTTQQSCEEVSIRQRKGKPSEVKPDQERGSAVSANNTEMKRLTPEEPASDPVDEIKESENKRQKAETLPDKKETKVQTKPQKEAPLGKPSVEKKWHETPFVFNYLDGHSDLISCVDLDDDYVISGSRDTLVQVWCAKTSSPLMNLRGHTNAITCVCLLTAQQSKELHSQLVESDQEEDNPRLVISASTDCCIKLWNIKDGSALRSIYTFNSITALCYLSSQSSVAIGSEGGKLEIYSLLPEHVHPIASHRAFEGPLSAIKVQSENLICSSVDGFLSVYVLRESGLCRIYNSDDLVLETGQLVERRPILTTTVAPLAKLDSPVFFGDEGSSIKVLTWKTGRVRKLRNHTHEFGQTNAVFATHSFLLSSSINIDTGDSSVNVFALPQLNYLGTLGISGLGRIVCLAAIEDETSLRIAIGGSKLTVLETKGIGCKRSAKKDLTLRPKFVKDLALPAGDSEDESSASSEDEIEDEDEELESNNVSNNESKGSWCQIL